MPCGFCGKSNDPRCKIYLTISSGDNPYQISTCDCPEAPPNKRIPYGLANKGTRNNVSRNVPIPCQLCSPLEHLKTNRRVGIWRYNMETHIRSEHEHYATPTHPHGRPLPRLLWEDMEITSKEENNIGIPLDKQPAKFIHIETVAKKADKGNSGGRETHAGSKRMRDTDDRGGPENSKRARVVHFSEKK